jgi:L-lysine 2,3-aminomutase
VTAIQLQSEPAVPATGRRFRAYSVKHLDALVAQAGLDASERLAVRAVATVLPFRTNAYVVENLIDWDAAPDDPIYRLVFPQADMLPPADVQRIAGLLARNAPEGEVAAAAHEVRTRLNPHPAGQLALNIPDLGDEPLPGVQHKYPETVLVFPKQAQTCHAYCTYCFRWAQFVDEPDLKMATADTARIVEYLRRHREVTSVLITGGDPMIMGADVLRRYVEPLLDEGLGHIESVRIGSKSLAYWPQRFVTDPDADDTLRLFEKVVASGRGLAFMAHFSHPRELESPLVAEAVRRIRSTGAVIRTQAPLIRSINDNPATWAAMWRTQVRMGMVPYYMFVERDTGPQDYFAVPLAAGYRIFRDAYQGVSGLGRTVRGPSMSATPGKLCVDGITEVAGEKVFVLHMIQARDPDLVGKPFFARYDPDATWLSDLEPAFASRFPFEPGPEELPELLAPPLFEPAG